MEIIFTEFLLVYLRAESHNKVATILFYFASAESSVTVESRVSFETSFDSKQPKLEPKLVSALSETKRLFRLFRFYTETESFDVSIEPKQTKDQPKQFHREHVLQFFTENVWFIRFFRFFSCFFRFFLFFRFFSRFFRFVSKQFVSVFRLFLFYTVTESFD
jgi:hypothetical protein